MMWQIYEELHVYKCHKYTLWFFHHSIAAVKSPVIIMHAEDDLVIPYDLGLKVSTCTGILGKLPYTCTSCRSRDCLSICLKN